MSRRSKIDTWPVYRAVFKSDTNPTCVVAGPNRRSVWLYVHASTPTVLRLHPPVVRFLLDALAELAARATAAGDRAPLHRRLRRDTTLSHPECAVAGHDHTDAWLYVHADAPSAVQLTPTVIAFLTEALAELPAAPRPRNAAPLHLVPDAGANR